MNFEEKLKEILGEENAERVEDINKVLPSFFVPKSKYNDLSSKYNETESVVRELNEKIQQEENSKLTAEQKLQKALEDAQKEKAEYSKKSNKIEAIKLFVNAGLQEEDYGVFIDDIVSDSSEKTVSLATAFVKTLEKQKEAITKQTKQDLLKDTPRGGIVTEEVPTLTREDLKQMSIQEQNKLFKENPDLYRQLTEN